MKKKEKISCALVGCGVSGWRIFQNFKKVSRSLGFKMNAIIEPDSSRRAYIKSKTPADIKFYSSLKEFYAESNKTEVLLFAVPKQIQFQLICESLEKGYHTLVEAPLVQNNKEAEKIRELAQKNKRHVQVLMPDRWHFAQLWDDWKPAKGAWVIQTDRSAPFQARAADQGVLLQKLIHDIDFYFLLDEVYKFGEIKNLKAYGKKMRSRFLDFTQVSWETEQGIVMHMRASRLSQRSRKSWNFIGPNWHASIDLIRNTRRSYHRVGSSLNAFEAQSSEPKIQPAMALELLAFKAAMQSKKKYKNYRLDDLNTLSLKSKSILKSYALLDRIRKQMKVI